MPVISRRRMIPVPYLVCLLFFLVLPVLAEGTGGMDIGNKITLPAENQGYSSPSLSGDSILFFAGNRQSGSPDLFCYKISTGELTLVCQGGKGLDSWSIARIGGRWAVYTKRHRTENQNSVAGQDIFTFDQDSGRAELLGTSFGTSPGVSVYDDIVVWENGTTDRIWPGLTNTKEYFVIYNLSTHTRVDFFPRIPDNPDNPVVYNDLLVYAGSTYHPENRTTVGGAFTSDIFCYNISSGKEMQVSFSGAAYTPSVSGTLIAWEDNRNGNGDIYLYNLSNSEELPLCTDPADQRNPKISGDWVVWEDRRHQPAQPSVAACPSGTYCPVETPVPPVSDIYLYNLTSKRESWISAPMGESSDLGGEDQGPDVSGHRVIWTRYGGMFLYPAMNETVPTRYTGPQPDHAIPGTSPPTTQPAGEGETLLTAFAFIIAVITFTMNRRG